MRERVHADRHGQQPGARERDVLIVHDFAYADLGFDGYEPPSILQAEGAKECAVELYSMTKGFSMAGWRIA